MNDPGIDQRLSEIDQLGRTIEPGQKQYQVFERLGSGGQGTCFRAVDQSVSGGLEVCLKVVFADDISAGVPRSVRHSGIAQVFDSGQDKVFNVPVSYVAYEFIQGESLDEWTRQRAMGVKQTCDVLMQICDAIQTCHNHLVAHRDLKPSNIMMEGSRPVVVDFGISSNGRIKSFTGTPMYMAPEQAGMQEVSTLVDVYGIGAIGYYMLTGEAPNGPNRDTAMENLRLGVHADCSSIPASLRGIIARCLDHRTGMRYQSVSALRDDLERVFDGRVPTTRAATIPERYKAGVKRHPYLAFAAMVAIAASVIFHIRHADRVRSLDKRLMATQQLHEFRYTTLQTKFDTYKAYRIAMWESQKNHLSSMTRWQLLNQPDDVWIHGAGPMMSIAFLANHGGINPEDIIDHLSNTGKLLSLEKIEELEHDPAVDPIELGDWYFLAARALLAYEKDEDYIDKIYQRGLKHYAEVLPFDSPKYQRAKLESEMPLVEVAENFIAPRWMISIADEQRAAMVDSVRQTREATEERAMAAALEEARTELALMAELDLME